MFSFVSVCFGGGVVFGVTLSLCFYVRLFMQQNEFEVEKIMGKRFNNEKKTYEFLIKWKVEKDRVAVI